MLSVTCAGDSVAATPLARLTDLAISATQMLIVEETIVVATAAGPMGCLVLRPKSAGRRFPGLIFYSEIYQITGPIKRTCALLASHGFVVVVPEVYHELLPAGAVLSYTPEDTARGNTCKTEKALESYDSDASAAAAWLAASEHCTGRVGAAGTCLGGGLAFRAALLPAVRAAVCFYATDLHKGHPAVGGISSTGDDTLARAAALKDKPVMMIYGRQDPHVPAEGRRIVYDALTAAGADFEWHEFCGVHAFLRDESSGGRVRE